MIQNITEEQAKKYLKVVFSRVGLEGEAVENALNKSHSLVRIVTALMELEERQRRKHKKPTIH